MTRDGALRANNANRVAVISMVAGYFAFFSVNLNLGGGAGGVQWPYKEEMQLVLLQWGGKFTGPCSDGGLLEAWPTDDVSLCDAFAFFSAYQVHMVVVLWVVSFQLACELPSGKLDDFITRTMVPLLADAGYMVIAEACLAYLDCSAVQASPGSWSWMVDDSCQPGCEAAGDCTAATGECGARADAPARSSWECSGPWQRWAPTGDPEQDQELCEAASMYESGGDETAGCAWDEGDGGCEQCWVGGHEVKVLLAMLAFGLYFPVATTSGVLMQPDDEMLDVNTKPIWDITLKIGEIVLVAASIFLSSWPLLCGSINLVVVSALLVLHNGWGPTKYLGDPSGNTQGASTLAVSPASTSVVINKLSSFLLCCALWTTVCSIVVVVRCV